MRSCRAGTFKQLPSFCASGENGHVQASYSAVIGAAPESDSSASALANARLYSISMSRSCCGVMASTSGPCGRGGESKWFGSTYSGCMLPPSCRGRYVAYACDRCIGICWARWRLLGGLLDSARRFASLCFSHFLLAATLRAQCTEQKRPLPYDPSCSFPQCSQALWKPLLTMASSFVVLLAFVLFLVNVSVFHRCDAPTFLAQFAEQKRPGPYVPLCLSLHFSHTRSDISGVMGIIGDLDGDDTGEICGVCIPFIRISSITGVIDMFSRSITF
mmetsp:Transcript_6806/g.20689  ORF Transcript_6806/g.20689 Transcript_6806/m.20689 type:complete len:274 (-) Transcript_6806:245-1066(-)